MAATSLIGNLAVNLIMETAAFEKGATQAERQLRKMSRDFEKIGQNIGNIGKKLSLAITAPIVAAGAAVIKMTGDFEGAMNRVSISTQAGAADMKAMSDLALKLGKDSTFGATEAADAMDMLAKNGLSARQILDGAAKAAIDLASAAGSELSPAADAITDVMQQFKLTTADLPQVVNQITGAVNESKLDFEDFALAIGQAGGVAGAAGVDFDDFNAAIAGTSSLFASGSDAGTSFKTFIVNLTPTTKKAAAAMQEYGLQFFDAQGNMRSMAEIAEELHTKLGGLNEQARTNVLKTIFGTDAMRTAVGLMDQGAAGIDRIKKALAETDAADQAAKRMKGFNGQLEQLKGSIETLAIRIGKSGLLDVITKVVTALSNMIDRWSEASPATLRFATVLAVIAAAVGPVLAGFGLLVQGLAPLIAAFSALSAAGGISAIFTALGAALAPILPVVAAVAAAGALIYANWDKIGPVLADLWKQAKQTLGPPLQELIASLSAAFTELWSGPLGTWLKEVVSQLGTLAAAFLKTMGPVVIGAIRGVITAMTNFVQNVGDGIRLISSLMKGDFSGAAEAAFSIFNRVFLGIPAIVRKMVVAVKDWLVNQLGKVWDTVKGKIDAVKGWFYGLYDAVVGHSYIPDMVDGIAAQMKRLDDVMVAKSKSATDKTKSAFQKLAEDVAPLLDRLFPEAASRNQYRTDAQTIDRAEKGGALSTAQADEARRRLALEGRPNSTLDGLLAESTKPLTEGIPDFVAILDSMGEKAKDATKLVTVSFADMARDVLGSLQNLGNSIRSGGFLDIFSSALDLLLQLGSIGVFGKGIKTNLASASTSASSGFGGFRATGGPVVPSKSYIVGENGPEWFTPGSGGRITPMNGNGGATHVIVDASPLLDVHIDNRAARVAAPMAAASGHYAREAAGSDIQRRARRRIPG